ncbi:MAG TPA: PAS domain S-box protein [Nannocystaceae bacterium]|nr:PAS domain S-box protein [Nannocystaceae bacterium]
MALTVGPSLELLAAVIREAPVGIVVLDADGIVVEVNDAAHRMFGRRYVGGHISLCADKYEILRADGSACPIAELPLARAALHGEHVVAQPCLVRRPDGTITRVLADAQPLRDEQAHPLGALLVMRDVTGEHELEQRRRLQESRFESLVHATAQMVWTAGADGAVVEDSPSWRAFTGQTYEQYRGFGWLDAVHEGDRELVRRVWLTAVESSSGYEVEYRVWHHAGEFRWSFARGAPVRDADGVVREWVGCNWDVHAMKSAQETAARAAEFHQLMLGVVGHDLRSPLAAIQMAAELLKQGFEPAKVAPRILRSTRRASDVLNALLDVTQHRLGGGLQVQREHVDLGEVVREVVAEFDDRLGGRRVVLGSSGDTRGAWDRTRLGQVVANLLANALQHGRGDSVAIATRGTGQSVELHVENEAEGIADERIETMFEPFRRGDETRARGNIGLGLYIVRQLVDAHGGTVGATWADGHMRVTVSLPR